MTILEEMNAKFGLPESYRQKEVNFAELWRDEEKKKYQTDKSTARKVVEGIGNFTGGTKIAQGLGQALAAKDSFVPGANLKNPITGKTGTVKKGTASMLEEADARNMEIQGELLKRIKEKQGRGEDVSHLQQVLNELGAELDYNAGDREFMLNPENLTKKEVVGDALQLATTAVGGEATKGISKIMPGKGIGLVKGALKGAATGATAGTLLGATEGTAQALKKNKTAGGIAKSAVKGALVGGAGGAVVGGITGGITGKLQNNPIKEEDFVKDLVSPKATTAVKEQALKEGRVTEAGILKKSKILPGRREEQLAEVAKDYVSSKKPITENIDSVKRGVSEINEGVKDYVKTNKVPFNTNQLKTQLNKGKGELKLIFASDSNAEKTYNAAVKEFMSHVANKDTEGLLEARQKFDKIPAIKKLLDSQGLGENTKKEVVLTLRGMANKYIAELLPKGNQYRDKLLTESKLIEAMGNMAENATGMIGKNKLQLLTQEYPILKWLVGGFSTGLVGAAGVGVGGAVISSTD